MSRDIEVLVAEKCVTEAKRLKRILEQHDYKVSVKQNGSLSLTATPERKLAEEKFRENRNWLRAVFDASRDGILVEDEGKIVFINKAYARMLGYDAPEELFDVPLAEIVSTDDAQRMSRFGEARLRGESSPSVYEFKGKRKDGSLIDLEASVSTVVITGKTYIIAVDRDLTHHKRAAQLIKESEQRYRLLGDSILHQVWTAKPDGTLDYVNARTLEYSGLTEEQTFKAVWQNAVHPDDLPICTERWENSLSTGEPYEVEFRMRDAGGNYRWHLGRATAGRDADGNIIKWFGTNTDINDKKIAEESLRKSEERFQLAARATNDVMWDWDLVTNKIWLNESIREVFGYELDEVGDKFEWWLNGIHPEDRQEIGQRIINF